MAKYSDYVIGVDVGGTKILAAAFEIGASAQSAMENEEASDQRKGKPPRKLPAPSPIARNKAKTPRSGKAADLLATIEATVNSILEELRGHGTCVGIGVAVPGPLDRERGIVRYTPNLGLENYPLATELGRAFNLPVFLENDVQAGVFGELRAGALRGSRHAVGVFLGTGIGGGLVINGEIYRGATGSAGEIGHMILHEGGALCGCGNYGCLEALASRTALAKDAIALAASGKAPAMLEAAGTDFAEYKSSAFEAALTADEIAIGKAVDRTAFWLGVGLANLVNILNPETIVLGGGLVARFGERIKKGAKRSMEERLMPSMAGTVKILVSELGDLAVPAGAAFAAAEGAARTGSPSGRDSPGKKDAPK